MSIDSAIVDFSAGLFLRYFRGGAAIGGEAPRLDQKRDVEILKGHWSVSDPVRALVGHVLSHPGRVRQRGVNSVVASGLHFQAAFGVICSG